MSDKVFTLRIKEELLEKLRENAEKEKRSIGKQLEYIIEKFLGLDKYDDTQDMELQILFQKIAERLERQNQKSDNKKVS